MACVCPAVLIDVVTLDDDNESPMSGSSSDVVMWSVDSDDDSSVELLEEWLVEEHVPSLTWYFFCRVVQVTNAPGSSLVDSLRNREGSQVQAGEQDIVLPASCHAMLLR